MPRKCIILNRDEVIKILHNNNSKLELISTEIDFIQKSKYEFKCTICNRTFFKVLKEALRLGNQTGCKNCRGLSTRMTNLDVDERIKHLHIIRLENVVKSNIPINFQCLVCNYVWKTTPFIITKPNIKYGCLNCAGCAKVSNADIDLRLGPRPIKRIGNCINTDTPIKFKCLIEFCNNIWLASPANIINHNRGCPLHRRKNEKICIDNLRAAFPQVIHNYQLAKIESTINRHCSVDAFIPLENNKYVGIAIEYNGRQHYEVVTFGKISLEKAQENFVKQQISDTNKKKFCIDHNIFIIKIDGRFYKNKRLELYVKEIIIPTIKQIISSK